MKPFFYATVLALIVFSSCSNQRYVNSPSAYNASFFRQKGDMKFSASASMHPSGFTRNFSGLNDDTDNGYGLDGQAGFALSDHFLLEVGAMHRNETDYFGSEDWFFGYEDASIVTYKRNFFNVGMGYYTPLGKSGHFFNLVVDGAFGKVTSVDDADPFAAARHRTYEADPFKFSIKPSFNFFFNDVFRMSFAPRFALLKFNNVSTNYTAAELKTLSYDEAADKIMPVFEPSLHLQAGPRNSMLKFDLGFNFASNPLIGGSSESSSGESFELYSRGFLLTFGLSLYPFKK